MANAIQKQYSHSTIDFTFDLKGSSVARQVLPDALDSFTLKLYKKNQVLKDQDFRLISKFKTLDLVNLQLEDKYIIINKMKQDSLFLEANGIMDYSLLLAVEKISK